MQPYIGNDGGAGALTLGPGKSQVVMDIHQVDGKSKAGLAGVAVTQPMTFGTFGHVVELPGASTAMTGGAGSGAAGIR